MTISKSQLRYQKIVELHIEETNTQVEIAGELEISVRTVERYLSLWRRSVPVGDVRDVGRPTKLTDSVRGKIVAQLEKDEFSSSKEITEVLSADNTTSLTDRTVRNFLARLSFRIHFHALYRSSQMCRR